MPDELTFFSVWNSLQLAGSVLGVDNFYTSVFKKFLSIVSGWAVGQLETRRKSLFGTIKPLDIRSS